MRGLGCALVFALVTAIATGPAGAEDVDLAVIVHPSRATTLGREVVQRIYLKRQRFWSDGHAIEAINQEVATPAREVFTRAVFGDEAARLSGYWNEQYFHGVLPPITLASDEAVVRYVAARHVDSSVAIALRLR